MTNFRGEEIAAARNLLSEFPLIDGHNDLAWHYSQRNYDLSSIDITADTSNLEIVTDIPRLRAGGVGAQFWAVYVPTTLPASSAFKAVFEQVDLIHRMIERHSDTLELAITTNDIERIHRNGRIASLIGIEGGHGLDNSMAALRDIFRLGARYLTLTHNRNTDWADAAGDLPKHHGLTSFGENTIREMNRLGMLVDLSHASDETMRAALKVTTAPAIFSHSGARAICDHLRNVPDDVLEMTAENGGIVMVCFLPGFVSEHARHSMMAANAEQRRLETTYPPGSPELEAAMSIWRIAHPARREATVSDVASHIDHIRKIAGIDHIGIGSDFDGYSGATEGLEDVSKFPALIAELLRRGYSKNEIRKIAGLNFLRVMKSAEEIASGWEP